MNQTCPQCFSQLASSEVGNLCVNCGYLQRRLHNHAPAQDDSSDSPHTHSHEHTDHITPGNLEAPRGLDELLFNAPPTEPPKQETSPNEQLPSVQPPAEKPQIINHRTSSQYRRRLEKQIETLSTPEIESPLEPESSLEAPEQPEAPQVMPLTTESETTQQTPHPTADDSNEADDVIEVSEPHRPSPYLLNMSDGESESDVEKPEYRSPLDVPPVALPPQKHTHTHTAKPAAEAPPTDAAMARADALLAAAASAPKAGTSSKTNYIIIAVTIVLLLGVGSFLAFTLLRPPASQTTSQPTTTSAPSTAQSSSPTPTNLTESAKRDSERKDTLNTIAIALAAYKKANGTYPSGNDIEVLSALTSSNPPYLREIKTDPLSNSENGVIIKYGYNSDGSKFTLTASLENKQDPDAVNGLYVVKSP